MIQIHTSGITESTDKSSRTDASSKPVSWFLLPPCKIIYRSEKSQLVSVSSDIKICEHVYAW